MLNCMLACREMSFFASSEDLVFDETNLHMEIFYQELDKNTDILLS